jgi:hypothetical protein
MRVGLWSTFLLVSAVTPVVYRTAYALSHYYALLAALGTIALAAAIVIVARETRSIWSWVLVCAGLAIGQWWFLEMTIVVLGWKIRGFAP